MIGDRHGPEPTDRDAGTRLSRRWRKTMNDQDSLLAKYVEPHPARAGAAEARIKDRGVSIWALIGTYLLTPGEDAAAQVARAYGVPLEAMEAAIEYYKCHKREIDTRLAELDVA